MSTIKSLGDRSVHTALTVQAQMNDVPNSEFTSIEPTEVNSGGSQVIYHYMIYDLCQIQKDSNFKMNIIVNGGEYNTKVLARLDKISKFNIICS